MKIHEIFMYDRNVTEIKVSLQSILFVSVHIQCFHAEKVNILFPLGNALGIIFSMLEGDIKGNFVFQIHAKEKQAQY